MAEKEGKIKIVNEEEGIVILEEYNGEEYRYEIVTVIEIEDIDYLILLPGDNDGDGEGYALKATDDENGKRVYQPVIDEEELAKLQEELAKED
ncbi:DUF1292 domain-containing protein [Orenia marismortui]|uniref:Uncharacterized protein DUF1292 n=1 Tax=Orenia marismortui TaxID=46469 RepID=A0A4V3GX77_9FIRM|nr:DUF1292 domain-containing protein [Orenia marismortui]TDX46779.1 uncharacterized protein DUF1292 [Orenia marismortui]